MSAPDVCRSCESRGLADVLSLGRLPLANSYPPLDGKAEEPRYPLDVAFCPSCTLVQLREAVPPEAMFRDYLYFSSYSDTMLDHAQGLATRLVQERKLGPRSLVIEAASNDGYLLQYFSREGVPVLGIEPAVNVAKVAQEKRNVPTLTEFFSQDLAHRLRSEERAADVFLALNVLAHVPDLNGFAQGIRTVLKDDGVAVIEVPYARDMLERCEFDTIYHEHLCYFSVRALVKLFERHGLGLVRAEKVPIHGGSLRITLSPGAPHGPQVEKFMAEEEALGMGGHAFYKQFAKRVESVKASLVGFLSQLRSQEAKIAGYGAAAKGTVLLNACGIDGSTIDFVADRSPFKQGRRMPGCGIPILPPQAIIERKPDYVLILAWNLAPEIMKQQSEYRRAGGRFIVPIPKVKLA